MQVSFIICICRELFEDPLSVFQRELTEAQAELSADQESSPLMAVRDEGKLTGLLVILPSSEISHRCLPRVSGPHLHQQHVLRLWRSLV